MQHLIYNLINASLTPLPSHELTEVQRGQKITNNFDLKSVLNSIIENLNNQILQLFDANDFWFFSEIIT